MERMIIGRVIGCLIVLVLVMMINCSDKSSTMYKQSISKTLQSNVPKYAAVARNKNGHTIFIVTQVTKIKQFEAIVFDYKRRYRTPDPPWSIQFFTDKKKAIRVCQEWMEPFLDSKWVYQEDVDHGGMAQWTSWDGVTLDRW